MVTDVPLTKLAVVGVVKVVELLELSTQYPVSSNENAAPVVSKVVPLTLATVLLLAL